MERPRADLVIRGAAEVLTCVRATGNPLGRVAGGALAVAGERILAVGSAAELAAAVDLSHARVIDAGGGVVAPGFVDCHTHLVFGGSRAREYAAKMTRSAAEVAALGIPSGIPASVAATRAADAEALFGQSAARLKRMFASGSTTVESKSGYGLCRETELRQLEVNRRLNEALPVDLVSTFLGAHDFPPDLPRKRYVDLLVNELIPAVAERGLAEFCDVYCDRGYYTVKESRRILSAGRDHGLRPKIHADAYSATGIADLAIELGAVSMDHLNYTTAAEMKRLARAGVVGVALPALDFAVAHPDPVNPVAVLESGMPLALATNLNPGNWTETMHFAMVLACRRHRLAPEEALLAATAGAAKALGREKEIGALEPGHLADLQIWDIPAFEDYIYRLDRNPIVGLIKRGQVIAAPAP
jgi:imidazolonepropionase